MRNYAEIVRWLFLADAHFIFSKLRVQYSILFSDCPMPSFNSMRNSPLRVQFAPTLILKLWLFGFEPFASWPLLHLVWIRLQGQSDNRACLLLLKFALLVQLSLTNKIQRQLFGEQPFIFAHVCL